MKWLIVASSIFVVLCAYAMATALVLGSLSGWGLIAGFLGTLWLAAATDNGGLNPEESRLYRPVLPDDSDVRRTGRRVGWIFFAVAFLAQLYEVMRSGVT